MVFAHPKLVKEDDKPPIGDVTLAWPVRTDLLPQDEDSDSPESW